MTALVLTPGRRQWLRMVGAAALAFLLAFTGITIPELFLGHSLANPDRATTYSVPGKKEPVNNPSGGGGGSQSGNGVPAIVVTPDVVDCGTVDLGSNGTCTTIVRSTGTANLRITRIDSPDPAGEFTVDGCVGLSLPPEAACELHITFTPAAADTRTAQIVVHQNIPLPDRGTAVTLTGTGGAGPTTTEPPPPHRRRRPLRSPAYAACDSRGGSIRPALRYPRESDGRAESVVPSGEGAGECAQQTTGDIGSRRGTWRTFGTDWYRWPVGS